MGCCRGTRSTSSSPKSYKFNSYIGGNRFGSKGLFCFNWLSKNVPEGPQQPHKSRTPAQANLLPQLLPKSFHPRQQDFSPIKGRNQTLDARPVFKEARTLGNYESFIPFILHNRNSSEEILRDENNFSWGTSIGSDWMCSAWQKTFGDTANL